MMLLTRKVNVQLNLTVRKIFMADRKKRNTESSSTKKRLGDFADEKNFSSFLTLEKVLWSLVARKIL